MTVAWNGASPGGIQPPPWLSATFDDEVSSGTIVLTLTASNLMSSEKVRGWYFNLDPTLDPTQLVFSAPTKTGSFDNPVVSTGDNSFKADGDGYFDILVEFATDDGGTHSFGAGDTVQYTISGITSLTANSFDFISFPDGGVGEYPTVAHVLGIGGSDSGWVTIPEPATILLLCMGVITLMKKS